MQVPARAAEPEAHQRAAELEKAARAEFSRESYAKAAELFERANGLAPFPELRYNAALSWDNAGDKPHAADAYESALQLGGLDPARASESGSRLTALKRELAYVRVLRPLVAVVSVGHLKRAAVPVNVHLSPGRHELVFELPDGTRERKMIEATAGETLSVSIELPERKTPGTARKAPPKRVEKRSGGDSTLRTLGFVALGTGVVLGGVTTYLGLRTLDERQRYKDSNLADLDARDRGLTLRTWTNVALAGAIISASAGGVLLVVGSGSDTPSASRGLKLRVAGERVFGTVTF
jgi:tetratricopeptide (TPR) repeat protein